MFGVAFNVFFNDGVEGQFYHSRNGLQTLYQHLIAHRHVGQLLIPVVGGGVVFHIPPFKQFLGVGLKRFREDNRFIAYGARDVDHGGSLCSRRNDAGQQQSRCRKGRQTFMQVFHLSGVFEVSSKNLMPS